jgi:hypothetical protein
MGKGPEDPSIHCRISLEETNSTAVTDLFDLPFQAVVRVLHDIPDKPHVVYDFFGVFDDAVRYPLSYGENAYFSTLPSFLAFHHIPVTYLYEPVFADAPSLPEMRGRLLALFQSVLEPLPAELLVLWLMGRRNFERHIELPIGIISLNLYRCKPVLASWISHMLTFLCTTLNIVPLTVGGMNEKSMLPGTWGGEYVTTAFSAARETRMVVDETQLEEGVLEEQGWTCKIRGLAAHGRRCSICHRTAADSN